MPMERDRYPEDWEAIARSVKDEADWKCKHCHRPCRRPSQSWGDLANDLINDGWKVDLDKPTRFVLTVAHLDQDPSNNDSSNLRALCAPCHLKNDAPFRLSNRTAKRERRGQLTIFPKP